ncbi:MAG: DNRLRE domain-containing protein [Thermoplasmatales archaeon]|nr:MAG: DNRLRE domain-containing protein [Thermoplasmatales archaeon]
MENKLLSKNLVIGLIILFVGASIVSGINNDVESVDVINKIGTLNIGTDTFYPIDDTFIDKPDGTNLPRGDYEYMIIQNEYGATPGWQIDSLITFDISSVPSDSIILSAELKLYYHQWYANNPAGRQLNLYKITSDWDEETATWNNQPSYASQPTTSSPVPSSTGTWMEWDVTEDIKDFVSGQETNYGWKVTDENYWGTFDIPQTFFRTKESSYVPYLEIEVLVPHMAFLFGRIENLNTEGDLTTFDAVRLRYLQFSPFSFNTYVSGEEIAVIGSGLGIITTGFAFGFFNSGLL